MSGNSINTLKSRVTPFFEEDEYLKQPQNTFVPRGGLFASNPNGTDTCSGIAGFNFYGAGVQIDPVASGETVGVYIPGGAITELTGSSLASTVTLGTSYTTLQNSGGAPYQYVLGAGFYYLSANIPIVDSTSADAVSAQFYNVTNSTVVGVPVTEGATGQPFMLTLFNKLTLTGTCTIALQAKNATSARGTAGLNGVVFDVISMSGGNAYSWPIITSFSPVYGLSGTSVTITGAGFTGATAVSFYGTAASFTVVSDTSITCTVPTLAGGASGAISVAGLYGTAVSSASYYYLSSLPSGIKGFVLGGASPSSTAVATAYTIIFATSTTSATSSANLSVARTNACGVSNQGIKGYSLGGNTGSAYVATTDKTVFGTNVTATQTSANLTTASASCGMGVSEPATQGYILGGYSPSGNIGVTTAYLLTYSSDSTAAQSSANLSVARALTAGVSNGSTAGYILGGVNNNGSWYATTDKLIFSTNTTSAQTSANLTSSISDLAGLSDGSTNGYIQGGRTGTGPTLINMMDKLVFSTNTTSALSGGALMPTLTGDAAGITSGSTNGYILGGYTSGANTLNGYTFTYSTTTMSATTSANLGAITDNMTSFSDQGF